MCLLAIAWNTHPTWRVLLAGNRDEFHERPTAALARWTDRPDLVGGRDLQSGGTWLAVGPGGRMATVTNVRDPALLRPGAPSRGALVTGFLAGAEDAKSQAESLQARAAAFAPFNLLLADADQCMYLSNYPAPRHAPLSPGVHGLSNGDLDEPWPKTLALAGQLRRWIDSGTTDVDALWRALADETPAADRDLPDTGVGLDRERMLSPAFIRHPIYGTRASTLLAIDHRGRGWITERRFGPEGVALGETTLRFGE